MFIFLVFAYLIILIVILWIIGVLYVNNFSLSTLKTETIKRVLLVYPHPDDEALSAGGLIKKLVKKGISVTLVTLTEGEKSRRSGLSSEVIRDVRKRELKRATSLLGVTKVIHRDYGDKELKDKAVDVKEFLARTLEEERPDVIITYDLSGLYGHIDHIVCSEIVTELVNSNANAIQLLYNTYPKRVLSTIHLKEEIKKGQIYPNQKIFIGFQLFAKIRALYAYKSQLQSFKRGFPAFIPLWLVCSLLIFEYYYSN